MSEIVKKSSERDCLLPSEVMDFIVDHSIAIRDELSKDNPKINTKTSKNSYRDGLHKWVTEKLWLNFVQRELQKNSEWFKKQVEKSLNNLSRKLKQNPAIHDLFYDDKWNIYLENFIKLMSGKFWSNHAYLNKYADKIYDNSKSAYLFANRIYKDKKTWYIMKMEWSWIVFVYNQYRLSTKWKTAVPITDEKTQNEILSDDWYILILDKKNDNNQLTGHIIGKWFTDKIIINNFQRWPESIKNISYYWDNREILTMNIYGEDRFESKLEKKSDWTWEINKLNLELDNDQLESSNKRSSTLFQKAKNIFKNLAN